MNIDNNCSLSAVVSSIPKYTETTLGFVNCKFWVTHNSEQKEAGFKRKVWCNILVSINEQSIIEYIKNIKIGSKLKINGFLTTHKNQGISQLVLHSKQLEIIN